MKSRSLYFTSVMALMIVLLGLPVAADPAPIWMNALDSDTDSTVDGGEIINGPSAHATGAIGNAFSGNGSRYINWDNTDVAAIFDNVWNSTQGHTIDLYFSGNHWSTHTGDSGLFSIVDRGGGNDGFYIIEVQGGKLRYSYRDSYTNYAVNAVLSSVPLTNGVVYRVTVRQQGTNFELYLDDIGGSVYSNAAPVYTATFSETIDFPAPAPAAVK